jgi:rubrerythrin
MLSGRRPHPSLLLPLEGQPRYRHAAEAPVAGEKTKQVLELLIQEEKEHLARKAALLEKIFSENSFRSIFGLCFPILIRFIAKPCVNRSMSNGPRLLDSAGASRAV